MKNPEECKFEIRNAVQGINNYVQYGLAPGGFVKAVLSNDLKGAFGKADLNNRENMFEIVKYCYNEIPANCWGSNEAVQNWLNKF